jgi:hypothetical protein
MLQHPPARAPRPLRAPSRHCQFSRVTLEAVPRAIRRVCKDVALPTPLTGLTRTIHWTCVGSDPHAAVAVHATAACGNGVRATRSERLARSKRPQHPRPDGQWRGPDRRPAEWRGPTGRRGVDALCGGPGPTGVRGAEAAGRAAGRPLTDSEEPAERRGLGFGRGGLRRLRRGKVEGKRSGRP